MIKQMLRLNLSVKQNLLSLFLGLSLLVAACGGGGDSGGGSGTTGGTTGPFVPVFVKNEIERSPTIMNPTDETPDSFAPDSLRSRYIVFNLATDAASAGEYTLALREGSRSKPTLAEMSASKHVIVRKLSETGINIHMSYHFDGVLIAESSADTIANFGRSGSYDKGVATIVNVEPSRLKPSTTYKLYASTTKSTDVHEVATFTTDALPAAGQGLTIFPPHDDRSYTFRANEFILINSYEFLGTTTTFPHQRFIYQNGANQLEISDRIDTEADWAGLPATMRVNYIKVESGPRYWDMNIISMVEANTTSYGYRVTRLSGQPETGRLEMKIVIEQ